MSDVDLNSGVWPVVLAVLLLVGVHFLYPEPNPFSLEPVEDYVPWKDLLSTFVFIYAMLWLGATCHQLIKALGGYRELLRLFFCEEEYLEGEEPPGTPLAP